MSKRKSKKQTSRAAMLVEDLRLLQKSIVGKSVYRSNAQSYRRVPKYSKLEYQHYR